MLSAENGYALGCCFLVWVVFKGIRAPDPTDNRPHQPTRQTHNRESIMSLITSQLLRYSYNKAVSHDIEYQSDKFWLNYLRDAFPTSENYLLGAQQAPDDSDSRDRIDITVQQVQDDGTTAPAIMFCEVKRKGTGEVRAVEKQVKKAAKTYLRTSEGELVYCITAWGVKARCWVVQSPDCILQPMFGPDESGRKDAYIDADSEEAIWITHSILYMKGESDVWPGTMG